MSAITISFSTAPAFRACLSCHNCGAPWGGLRACAYCGSIFPLPALASPGGAAPARPPPTSVPSSGVAVHR